jgi:hypothetical protein
LDPLLEKAPFPRRLRYPRCADQHYDMPLGKYMFEGGTAKRDNVRCAEADPVQRFRRHRSSLNNLLPHFAPFAAIMTILLRTIRAGRANLLIGQPPL